MSRAKDVHMRDKKLVVHSRRKEQQQRWSVPPFGLQATETICLSLHTLGKLTAFVQLFLLQLSKRCVFAESGAEMITNTYVW